MGLLERLDFVQILSIGISGFGFLLILLAFLLIYKEQNRPDEPRKGILSTIRFFMGLNFLSVVVVGILSLPLISNNGQLQQEKIQVQQKLAVKDNELSLVQRANEFDKEIIANTNVLSDGQITKAENYLQVLDSLTKSYSTAGSPKADSAKDFKFIIADQLNTLKSDTASLATRSKALKRINVANQQLTKMVGSKPDKN